ncbi:MAG: hypothetical protein MUF24_08520 [Chitinophagaceae bacterium]|nr:hypothetical protein [Chitinophagaceae bacterium]
MVNIKTNIVALCLLTAISSCTNSSRPVSQPEADTTTISKGGAGNATDSTATDSSKFIPATYRPPVVQLVKGVLQKKYAADLDKNLIDSSSRRFTLFEFDMNGDGTNEIWVALNGRYFCGTGGCTILLLNAEGNTITPFTVTDTPVVIAAESSGGWRNIFLSHGGKYRLLKYNGKSYPSNPSLVDASSLPPGDDLPRLFDTENEPYPVFTF